MSAATASLGALCKDLGDRLDAGEKPTFDDYALMGFVQYRIRPLIDLEPRRDRLNEILADMHARLDTGVPPTDDEVLFADMLVERMNWVDTLYEATMALNEG